MTNQLIKSFETNIQTYSLSSIAPLCYHTFPAIHNLKTRI